MAGIAAAGIAAGVVKESPSKEGKKDRQDKTSDAAKKQKITKQEIGQSGNLENKEIPSSEKPFTKEPFENNKLKPNIRYQAGEYEYFYETDSCGRITGFNTDDLQLTKRDGRLTHDAETPGKLEGDHAGHLAGDRFGGSPHLDNLVSQSQDVNLREYKKIENRWAEAIKQEKNVSVSVKVNYKGDDSRPTGFDVNYSIDGDEYLDILLND